MSYDYQTQRPFLFTEEGQLMFLKIRDNVHRLLKEAGAARMQEIIACCTGDSWGMLACVDRLVEIGELRELTERNCWGQHRVFVSAKD